MKSIFIAEGENHVRDALRLLIEFQPELQVVGEADHAESLLAQVCANPPDIILLDWNLPGIHHGRLIRTLREHCPATQILATSVKSEQEDMVGLYDIDGFLLKQLPPDQFITALFTAVNQSEGSR